MAASHQNNPQSGKDRPFRQGWRIELDKAVSDIGKYFLYHKKFA
jgi:hypothetical protein